MTAQRISPLNALRAWFHKLLGSTLFRLKRWDRSRRHFERVLEIRGDDFGTYVYLGRLAWNLGDFQGWRRECEHARRTAPDRFARLRSTFEPIESRAAESLDAASDRATWRPTFKVSPVETLSEAAGGTTQQREGVIPLFADDFSSPAERDRFRSLGSIDPAAIREVDFEELARRLAEG